MEKKREKDFLKKKNLKTKIKKEIEKILDQEESDIDPDNENEILLADNSKTKDKLKSELSGLSEKFGEKLNKIMDEAIKEFETESKEIVNRILENQIEDSKADTRNYFSEKKFLNKDSTLTIMFNTIPEIRTLYNICFAVMVILTVNLVVKDYLEGNDLFHYRAFFNCFGGFMDCFFSLFLVLLYSILVIPFTRFIIDYNVKSIIWIPIYIPYILSIFYFCSQRAVSENYSFGTTMIITCEGARISMKIHAYLRNKILYCTKNEYSKYIFAFMRNKGIKEADIFTPEIKLEDFSKECSKFIYFFFAPTLIFRDTYKLRKERNYSNLIFSGFNFYVCVYFGFLLYSVFLLPTMRDDFKNKEFALMILRLIMPSLFCLLLLFYGLLHSWLNMWSEILLFPDRSFYEDWWNSLEFGAYYRKWNIVVHEWLYYYLYLDIMRFSKEKISRNSSQLLTFLISAIIHEFILTYTIGFFYPALFIIFLGPGVVFIRNSRGIKKKEMNIAFWFLLFIGTSLLIVVYFREYQVRQLIDSEMIWKKYGFYTPFIPRSLLVYLDEEFPF